MNLTCPACGAPFSADDVHVRIGIANCRVCRGVLDLRARDRSAPAPRPTRFVVDESDGTLRIEWRWFRPSLVFVLPFAVVWWLFLIAAYSHMRELKPMLLSLGHVAAGVFMLYVALANLLNRTRLVADDETLTVRHWPVPSPGKHLERGAIARLSCETVGTKSVTFALVAVDSDGKHVRIAGGFEDASEARWLKATLERRLKIPVG